MSQIIYYLTMNNRLYFMAAFVFKLTASQTFTHSRLLGSEKSLTLRCTTVDYDGTIVFKLGPTNKGGCVAGSCNTRITGYEKPTQPGSNITEMVITSCNETRDAGSWTCAYGGSTSDPVNITDCSSGSGGAGGGGGGYWLNKDWATILAALICDVIGDIPIYLFLVKRRIFLHSAVDGYIWLQIRKVLLIEAILPVIFTVLVDVLMYCYYGEYQIKFVIPITVVLAVGITIGYTFILTLRKGPGRNRLQTVYVKEEAIVGGKIILLQDQPKFMKPVKHIEWQHEGVSISGNSKKKFQEGTVKVPTLLITGITENDGGKYTCNIVLADDRAITYIVDLKIKNNTTGIPRNEPHADIPRGTYTEL